MNDRQQLAAMGEHMRDMEWCNHEFKVPDGWKLVPLEPTIEMCNSGAVYDQKAQRDEFGPTFAGCYRAMLAAAPEYEP